MSWQDFFLQLFLGIGGAYVLYQLLMLLGFIYLVVYESWLKHKKA